MPMIIDCHGHYTTEPQQLHDFRKKQTEAANKHEHLAPWDLKITDDQIRESLEGAQLKFQRERGTDLTIFSPRAAGMGHHIGDARTSLEWTRLCNDLIHRVCTLYPRNFIGVCQLPQSPGVSPANCVEELERCVTQYGFVGCNLNPDPSGGYWKTQSLADRWWYPLYEKMVELDVPAMIHVSASCNACVHTTGAHYINGDTTAFMQLILIGSVQGFSDAEIHHSARRRRRAVSLGPLSRSGAQQRQAGTERASAQERVLRHLRLSPAGNGAADQGDSDRKHPCSHRKWSVRCAASIQRPVMNSTIPNATSTTFRLSAQDKQKIFEQNALRVYPRLGARLKAVGLRA